MRSMRILILALPASLALASVSWAQAPAIPAAPAGIAAPTAAPPAPANLWSFFCLNADQKAACKNCFCNSPLGKLVSGGAGPLTMVSGGMIPNCCAQNSLANDLQKSAESPAGAAAKVKADEADAKARAAAVRYLANVDCERWPEATETLKNALRKDRNECVRLEAALALRNGCCCNNETIDALKNCVLGEAKTDPNPVERSERVRLVAAEALSRCVMVQPVEDPREKVQKTEASPNPEPADYYKKLATMPRDQVVAGARAALVSMQKPVKAPTVSQVPSNAAPASAPATTVAAAPSPAPNAPHGNSLSGIVANAFTPGGSTEPRQPFFAGLTKTLTGKQDYAAAMPVRQELVPSMPAPTITTREAPSVVAEEIAPPAPRPFQLPRPPLEVNPPEFKSPEIKSPEIKLPEIKIVLPPVSAVPPISNDAALVGPRDNKGPMQVITFRPTSDFRLGAPVEVKAVPAPAPALEIIQREPEASPSGPRESRGTVTIEDAPIAPRR